MQSLCALTKQPCVITDHGANTFVSVRESQSSVTKQHFYECTPGSSTHIQWLVATQGNHKEYSNFHYLLMLDYTKLVWCLSNQISKMCFVYFWAIVESRTHYPHNRKCIPPTLIDKRISARPWIEDLFSQSTYVRTCVRVYVCTWWVTLRNVTRNVVTYHRHRYRPYVRHTVWHI